VPEKLEMSTKGSVKKPAAIRPTIAALSAGMVMAAWTITAVRRNVVVDGA
jgi:hypothetical protein